MDEREKESQVEERSEVITEEGTERREEEIEEGPAIGEAVAEEEERCEEDPECHSSAKRARVCATFTDSEEVSIVEFVKLHPELYDKEHSRFHDSHCPEDQPLLPRSPRGSAYCQQPLHRHLVPLKQQLAAVLCTIHQAPLASATRHLS